MANCSFLFSEQCVTLITSSTPQMRPNTGRRRTDTAILVFLLHLHFVWCVMELSARPYVPVFLVNEQTTLICKWEVPASQDPVPLTAVYPLKLSRRDGSGNEAVLPVAPEAQRREPGGKAFNLTYGFTVQRSDHQSVYKCTASASGNVQEEKRLTLRVKAGPERPVLTGPVLLSKDEEGVWTCVSDGATEQFPDVQIIAAKGTNLNCTTCLTLEQEKYTDTYNLNTYKVVATFRLTAQPSWKEGDRVNLICRSDYKPFQAFSRTRFSDLLSVRIVRGSPRQGSGSTNNSGRRITVLREAATVGNASGTEEKARRGSSNGKDDRDSWFWWLVLASVLIVLIGAYVGCIVYERNRLKNSRLMQRNEEKDAAESGGDGGSKGDDTTSADDTVKSLYVESTDSPRVDDNMTVSSLDSTSAVNLDLDVDVDVDGSNVDLDVSSSASTT